MIARRMVVVLIALAFSLPTLADENRRDGNWWSTETPFARTSYMIGFFDGMDLGNNFSFWGIQTNGDRDKPNCLTRVIKSYEQYNDYFTAVTAGQLVDGLTQFYEDYRNRSIRIKDAVWIVVNTIAGKPESEIQELIENFRKNGK